MTLKELLNEAKNLNPQEQLQLATQLLQLLELKICQDAPSISNQGLRKPGLNRGSCVFTDDFDDPLPDEFWLGEL
jgi:hypothetical protein